MVVAVESSIVTWNFRTPFFHRESKGIYFGQTFSCHVCVTEPWFLFCFVLFCFALFCFSPPSPSSSLVLSLEEKRASSHPTPPESDSRYRKGEREFCRLVLIIRGPSSLPPCIAAENNQQQQQQQQQSQGTVPDPAMALEIFPTPLA